MDDTKRIPDMVLAQVRLHVAETEIRLETTKAANAGRPGRHFSGGIEWS